MPKVVNFGGKHRTMAMFSKLGKYSNFALLAMRAGVGFMMIMHGYPKMLGGPERWGKLGESMANFGITYAPEFWGFMAAFAETIGGVLLMLGYFTRPAALLLLLTMVVAATKHLMSEDGLMKASHSIELAFVFLGLFILGAGRYSIDKD